MGRYCHDYIVPCRVNGCKEKAQSRKALKPHIYEEHGDPKPIGIIEAEKKEPLATVPISNYTKNLRAQGVLANHEILGNLV